MQLAAIGRINCLLLHLVAINDTLFHFRSRQGIIFPHKFTRSLRSLGSSRGKIIPLSLELEGSNSPLCLRLKNQLSNRPKIDANSEPIMLKVTHVVLFSCFITQSLVDTFLGYGLNLGPTCHSSLMPIRFYSHVICLEIGNDIFAPLEKIYQKMAKEI